MVGVQKDIDVSMFFCVPKQEHTYIYIYTYINFIKVSRYLAKS